MSKLLTYRKKISDELTVKSESLFHPFADEGSWIFPLATVAHQRDSTALQTSRRGCYMHRSISSDEDLLREAANYGDVAQAISIKERRTCPRCRSRWRGGTSSGQTGVAKILVENGADSFLLITTELQHQVRCLREAKPRVGSCIGRTRHASGTITRNCSPMKLSSPTRARWCFAGKWTPGYSKGTIKR